MERLEWNEIIFCSSINEIRNAISCALLERSAYFLLVCIRHPPHHQPWSSRGQLLHLIAWREIWADWQTFETKHQKPSVFRTTERAFIHLAPWYSNPYAPSLEKAPSQFVWWVVCRLLLRINSTQRNTFYICSLWLPSAGFILDDVLMMMCVAFNKDRRCCCHRRTPGNGLCERNKSLCCCCDKRLHCTSNQ